jgi:hypothetical protein
MVTAIKRIRVLSFAGTIRPLSVVSAGRAEEMGSRGGASRSGCSATAGYDDGVKFDRARPARAIRIPQLPHNLFRAMPLPSLRTYQKVSLPQGLKTFITDGSGFQ